MIYKYIYKFSLSIDICFKSSDTSELNSPKTLYHKNDYLSKLSL